MMGDGFSYSTMCYGANGIFWFLLFILIVWLYSVFTNRNNNPEKSNKILKDHSTPVEILEKRLAEGKIDIEEFNKRLAHMNRDKAK